MYSFEELKKEIKHELSKLSGKKVEEIHLITPPKQELGDLSSNICFEVAKKQNKNPSKIAEEIASKLAAVNIEGIKEVKAVGAYVNFFIDYSWFSEKVLKEAIKGDYGSSKIGQGKTIFIDYSSVNIAKPMHVGHLRSTIIGNSLYKLLEYTGFNCFGENYLGDWGLQFGKLLYAYKQWGNEEKLKEDPIKHLHELYVKFHEFENEELKKKAEEEFSKLEKGDEENKKLWKEFKEASLKKFGKVYERLEVKFDSFDGEAYYSQFTEKVIKEALEKKVAVEEKPGTIIIPLEKYGLTNARLMDNYRTLYITREIAAAEKRKQEHNFYKALYVVSSAQSLHFQQLKKSLELLGYKWSSDIEHVKFGLFSLPEGKISTRKGRIIYLSDVLDKAVEKALEIINEKNPALENKHEVAEKIGIGAVKFADLSQNRIKDVVFDFDKMVSFEGDTSPYLQYAYVRCNSILEKSKQFDLNKVDFSKLIEVEEKKLIKKISEFPSVIEKSAFSYSPHLLAQYLIELTHLFSSFYEKYKISENPERILMIKSIANILKIGLNLLGIETIEKM